MMILLLVVSKDAITPRRYIAAEGASWKESLEAITAKEGGRIDKVTFPTEAEFFGGEHTLDVTPL